MFEQGVDGVRMIMVARLIADDIAAMLGAWRSAIKRQGAIELAGAMADCIQRGALPAETRLPGARPLAAALGCNRKLVAAAFGRLAERGLVRSRPRSGVVVCPVPSAGGTSSPRHA